MPNAVGASRHPSDAEAEASLERRFNVWSARARIFRVHALLLCVLTVSRLFLTPVHHALRSRRPRLHPARSRRADVVDLVRRCQPFCGRRSLRRPPQARLRGSREVASPATRQLHRDERQWRPRFAYGISSVQPICRKATRSCPAWTRRRRKLNVRRSARSLLMRAVSGPAANLPALCRVAGKIKTSSSSSVDMEGALSPLLGFVSPLQSGCRRATPGMASSR